MEPYRRTSLCCAESASKTTDCRWKWMMSMHLPYMRTWHPSYDAAGGVPAISEVKFSLVSNRGCFGGCSFCALTFHQGRIIQTRSHESIIEEAKQMTEEPDFKGYIHDVGGPTANFRHPACEKQLKHGRLPEPAVPVSEAVQESEGRPYGLSRACYENCGSFRK